MNLTKAEILNLIPRYSTTFIGFDDVLSAVAWVSDLLEEEAKATKREESYATNTIERYMRAVRTLREILYDLEDMEDEEV